MHWSGLWTDRSFALLWTGQTVSQLGSQVTLVALPLTAIVLLNANPVQVGLLTAAGFAPAALVGLFAGALVDRARRRELQIGCALVLTLTTASVPVANWLGLLRLEHLFALQVANGALAVFSSAAAQAYVPGLVRQDQLTDANAKLTTGNSLTRIVGPGFAGALVQLASGPMAMIVDALSFAFSAVCLLLIDKPEPRSSRGRRQSLFADIKEGLYLVLKHRLIRPLFISNGAYNFFAAIFVAVSTLFMVRELGLGAPSIGAVVACGGVGGVLGGLLATRLAERFGQGRPIVLGMVVLSAMHLVAPATFGPPLVSVPVLAAVGLLAQLSVAVMSINRTSLIQQLIPAHALGRVAATQQVVVLAAVPVGATLGGLIAEAIGLRATLAIAAVGTVVATVPLLRSALWTLDASAAEAQVEHPAAPAERSDEPPTVEHQLEQVVLRRSTPRAASGSAG